MASGSLKDVIRALDAAFSSSTIAPPLPEDLQSTIDAFLERHDAIDPADSQRLVEELHSIFQKHIQSNPDKHAAFISALRILRPAFVPSGPQLQAWWNTVLRPVIGSIGHKRATIDDAREFMLSVLMYDEDSDEDGQRARLSRDFTGWLLRAYTTKPTEPSANPEEIPNPGVGLMAHELEKVLIAFGRKKPKELLLAVDDLFIKSEHRARALSLLSAFVHVQPPHLYLVLETSLIDHLVTCLLVDTSGTVVDLALTVLVMFIPHIPRTLASYLPRLFLIFNRIVCWDLNAEQARSRSRDDQDAAMQEISPVHEEFEFVADPSWEMLSASYDNGQTIIPKVDYFFTFLYGLFPLNFMSFLRKPRRYFKNLNFEGAEEIDFRQSIVASRTEVLRRSHLLHPAFYSSGPEDEMSDTRFVKSDPAELVSLCLDLYDPRSFHLGSPSTSSFSGPPRNGSLREDHADSQFADDSTTFDSRRNPRSTAFTSPSPTDRKLSHAASAASLPDERRDSDAISPTAEARPRHPLLDSPTLPPNDDPPIEKKASTETMRKHGRRTPRGSNATAGEPGTATEPLPRPLFSCTSQIPPSSATTVASVQLENLRLRNELHFQQYLKSEVATFLGAAKRRELAHESTAADTQKLLAANRTLLARLKRQDERYEQLRKEIALRREGSRAWDKEVESKARLIRTKRDEARRDAAAAEELRIICEQAQGECNHLRSRLEEAESRTMLANETVRALKSEVDQFRVLEQELEKLRDRVTEYEDRELEFQRMREERDFLRGELGSAARRALARDREIDQIRMSAERAVADLESRLAEAQQATINTNASLSGQSAAVQQVVDAALATKQVKMVQLQKAYRKLHERCVDLELRNQELEAGHAPVDLGSTPALTDFQFGDGDDASSSARLRSCSATSPRSGRDHGLSRMSSGAGSISHPQPTSPISIRQNGPSQSRGPRDYGFVDETYDEHADNPRSILGRLNRKDSIGNARNPVGTDYQGGLAVSDRSHTTIRPEDAVTAAGSQLDSPLKDRRGTIRADQASIVASNKSTHSGGSGGSKDTGEQKQKVTTDSKMRVYGRGGAQNVGKKLKDKEKDKDKDKASKVKSGAFKGIMNMI